MGPGRRGSPPGTATGAETGTGIEPVALIGVEAVWSEGYTKEPRPTGMVATTVLLEIAITETVLSFAFVI